MAHWPGLVCLSGEWAGGTPMLTSHPLRTATDASVLAGAGCAGTSDLVGGGWFGVLRYDGGVRLAFHDHLVRQRDGQWWFESLGAPDPQRLAAWRTVLAAAPDTGVPRWTAGEVSWPARSAHLAAVEGAIELIRAGEVYQVNVCTRLRVPFAGSPAALFADLAEALAPARGAHLDGVVSLSPELFVRVRGGEAAMSPIKGTLPRDGADGNDGRLRASAKDAAENVMIVDLVRHELGRVCATGGVRVPRLLAVEPHPGVWHLVSDVTGRLRPGTSVADVLAATFPPGSVTGAPKRRAVEAIGALESGPRGAYTGAIGFASESWGAEFSVAIRTFEIEDAHLALGVGGGITADSVPVLEWRECAHKAAPLLRALGRPVPESPPVPPPAAVFETLLALDGSVLRLADHLARLERSTRELFGHGLPSGLAQQVRDAAAGTRGRTAVRVVAAPDGTVSVTAAPAADPPGPSAARIVARAAGVWRHKWADRTPLARDEAAATPGVPLYVAADGTVLETSRGNVFLLDPDGTLVTPPLRDDLLPGITRRAVLDIARDRGWSVELRDVALDELLRCAAFWTSSLSGAVPIASVDGRPLPRRDDLVNDLAETLFVR